MLALGMAASAQAILTGSNFEGSDGNLIVNTAGNTDWVNVAGRELGIDIASKSADDAFGQGTKEDNAAVTIVDGSIPPNKNNLSRFYEADEQVANGDIMLYLAWERLVNIGNANLDFEINQSSTEGWDNTTTGPITISRAAGDLLVTYDFSGQGTPTLGLNTWLTAAAGNTASECYSANALPCWGKHVTLTPGGNSEGAVNTTTVEEPIAGGTLTAGLFGEAAINLTKAGVFQPGVCKAFGSAFVKSRSSSSFTAELKDFIAPIDVSISNCSSIKIVKETDNAPANDTTSFGYTTTGTGLTDFSLLSGGDTLFKDLNTGTYTVTEGALPDYWNLKTLSCTGGANVSTSVPDQRATINLALGENVVCTFTNHYTNQPSISTTLSATTVLQGGSVHDSSTLSGATATAGGTVTYTVYTDSACTLNPVDAGTKAVTNMVVPDSNSIVFNTSGDYYWQAAYSGDANNAPAKSKCTDEHLVVKTAPSIGTVLQHEVITVGGSVYDSATLTNATSDAGGTVTYHAYAGQNTCTGTDLLDDTVTVTNGVIPDSRAITPTAAGWYSFQAVYSGDARNDGATSVCSSEQLLVMTTPSIATTLSATSIVVGGAVHDSSALTGATATAGGTVTYTVYTDSVCTLNPVDAGTKTVTNGTVPNSDSITFTTPGDYYWQAKYSGDTFNNPATSKCTDEHLVVKTAPSIGTVLQHDVISAGETVYDTAALSGVTPNAGGTVTYHAYAGQNTCTGTDLLNSTVTVTNGSVPNSAAIQLDTAGWYSFQAVYSGDAYNDGASSDCLSEQLLVKTNPTITTKLSAEQVVVDSYVDDTATLHGVTSDAGGTVTFTVYTDSACTLNAREAGAITVTNGIVPPSNPVQFTTPGDYYWQAVYSGDFQNNGATSVCTEEHLVVTKAPSSLTTEQDLRPQDAVAVTSVAGGTPTGSVTFSLFHGACSGAPVYTENVPLGAAATAVTNNQEFVIPAANADQYNWLVSYSGDDLHRAITGSCGSENFVLTIDNGGPVSSE